MAFVRRGADGRIDSLHRDAVEGAEFVADDHPDVQAFVGNDSATREGFDRLDADFVRVIEDVIDTLIVKNVINITDLPEQAQAKLFARKSFRERVSRSALRLYEQPTDFGDVI
ncbi:hypothetical protein [Piscinibacter sp.]|uniref:hypothetical protein n=1 Tax=Piscinibacter sp. TaxID=1903157 RepID=UPI0039E306B4